MAGEDRTANVVLTADTQGYSQSMVTAAGQTNTVTDSVNKLITSLDNLNKGARRELVIVSAATVATITAATVAAGRFEQQLSSLQATAAVTGRQMSPVQQTIDRIRRDMPVTTESVVQLANALQKLGSNQAGLDKTATTLIKLATATGEDLGQIATGMVNLQRSMGTTQSSVSMFADVLTNMSAKLGTSATGILQFSDAIAPIARTVGMTQQEVMGFAGAFTKAGQDGYAAANVFTKMVSDISTATRYGTKDLAMFAAITGQTVEQFKSMPATNQIVSIFDAINKQGPDAIKTLERMGMDGPRSLRAIQGLVQSGGIKQALGLAEDSAGAAGSTNRGYQAAADGLNDSLQKLGNSLTSISQAFGSTFLPVANSVVSVLAEMASKASAAFQPIAGLAGAMGGIVAGATGGLAGLMGVAGPVAAAAGGMMLYRNTFGVGRAMARQERTGQAPRSQIYRNSIASYQEGRGSPFMRGMVALGAGTGGMRIDDESRGATTANRLGMVASFGSPTQNARRIGSRLLGSAGALGATGLAALADATRAGYDPLVGRAARNVMERNQGVRSSFANTRQAFSGVGAGGMGGFNTSLRAAGSSMLQLTRSVASATAGLTRLGAAAVTSASTRAMMSRGLGGALGLVGGVPGLAMMGVAGGLAMYGAANQQRNELQNTVTSGGGDNSMYNRYATALGTAGAAAMSFAATLKNAEEQIPTDKESATQIRQVDIEAALKSGRKLTDPTLANMSESQIAMQLAGSLRVPNADTGLLQKQKLDIIQATGSGKIAEEIYARALEGGDVSAGKYLSGNRARDIGWGGFTSSLAGKSPREFNEALQVVAETMNTDRSTLNQFGEKEQNKYTVSQINSLLGQMRNVGFPEAEGITSTIAGQLGINPAQLNNAMTGAESEAFYAGNKTTTNDRMQILRDVLGRTQSLAGANTVFQGLSPTDMRATSYQFPNAEEAWNTADARAQRTTLAGRQYWSKNGLGKNLQEAVSQEGNENVQLRAARQWAQEMTKATGSTSEASAEFQKLKAQVGDLDAPLAQLASGAQQAADRLRSQQLIGASRNEQMKSSRTALVNAAQAPQTDEYEANLIEAEDQYNAARTEAVELVQGIVKAGRQFKQSRGWQREDFATQRERSNEQFGIQQSRSLYDYNLSRTRSDADFYRQRSRSEYDFNLQQKRGWADYNLSRARGEYDFNLSRKRSDFDFTLSRERQDDDYNVSRKRSYFDFNLSQKQAEYDFNLSRKRSEQDFNHQRELMARNTAKNLADIYTRINVQPTWDAQNLAMNAKDQANMFRQQLANLKKLRKMGISTATIQMLGLNDPKNAQQVQRMVQDLQSSPELIGEFNAIAKDRLKLGKAFAEDVDNEQWDEMSRQFKLAADRAVEDFDRMAKRGADAFERSMDRMAKDYRKQNKRMEDDYKRTTERSEKDWKRSQGRMEEDFKKSNARMTKDYQTNLERQGDDYALMTKRGADDFERMTERQEEDYARSMKQMVTDFEKQMDRAQKSFSQSYEDVSGDLGDLQKEALSYLSDGAHGQISEMVRNFKAGSGDLIEESKKAAKGLDTVWKDTFGVQWKEMWNKTADSLAAGKAAASGGRGERSRGGSFGGGEDDFAHRADAHGGESGGQSIVSPIHVPAGNSPAQRYGAPRAGGRKHEGTDFPAATGTPIYAALGGVITNHWSPTGGNVSVINHGGGLYTRYLHQSSYGARSGDTVAAGDRIGAVGNTGSASRGSHLHFEVRHGSEYGKSENPVSWLKRASNFTSGRGGTTGGAAGEPMSEKQVEQLGKRIDKVMAPFEKKLAGNYLMSQYMRPGMASEFVKQQGEIAAQSMGGGMLGGNVAESGAIKAYAKKMLGKYGWGAEQFSPLNKLWTKESGWRTNADNPTSSAYGIPQMMLSVHDVPKDYKTNPYTQVKVGLNYIDDRYGSPSAAWAHSQKVNWYGDGLEGGIFTKPTLIGVGEAGPERVDVTPLSKATNKNTDMLEEVMTRFARRNDIRVVGGETVSAPINNTYHQQYDASTNYTGPITVRANDPRKFQAELDEQNRMKRLTRRPK